MAHGLDHAMTGIRTCVSGEFTDSATTQLLEKAGMSHNLATCTDSVMSLGGSMGGIAALRNAARASFPAFHLPKETFTANNGWILPKEGGGAYINNRWYTEHALERMAPRTPSVMAELEKRFVDRIEIVKPNLSTKQFNKWWYENYPSPRGIPPSVVEAEIFSPGSTGASVKLNELGEVITVMPRGK